MRSIDRTVNATEPLARMSPRREALICVVIGVLSAALAFFRLSPASRGSMWAEDLLVFTHRALSPEDQPLWIFTGYTGYTHSVPQLVANVAWLLFPPGSMAIVFTIVSCCVVGAIAGLVYLLTAAWGLNVLGRVVLAAIAVLAPGLSWEAMGNLANLHWFFLYLAPFLFLARPRRWVTSAALTIAVLLTVTTEIQSLLFSPLLLLHIRDRKRWPLLTAGIAGGVVQVAAFLTTSVDRGDGERSWSSIIDGYFVQVPLGALTGSAQGASAVVGFTGWPTAYLSILPFVAAATLVFFRSRRYAVASAGLMAASVILWTGGFALGYFPAFNFAAMTPEQLIAGIPQLRYAPVPIMLLFAVVGLLIGSIDIVPIKTRRAAIAITVLVAALFASAYRVQSPSPHDSGPGWRDQIAVATADCRIDAEAQEFIVVAAPPNTPPWQLSMSCTTVTGR